MTRRHAKNRAHEMESHKMHKVIYIDSLKPGALTTKLSGASILTLQEHCIRLVFSIIIRVIHFLQSL